MTQFINIYDSEFTDMIIRIEKIDTIKAIMDEDNDKIRVDLVDGTFIMLLYDSEDERDDAFEDFVDDLCEEGGF